MSSSMLSTTSPPKLVRDDCGLYMSDPDTCVGHLIHFPEHGVYEPTLGLVSVPPEHVDEHNKMLDQMLITGLDKSCEVGQRGTFYLTKDNQQRWQVTTFTGIVVAPPDQVRVSRQVITFTRGDKTFRGRQNHGGFFFHFRRVS